MCGENVNAAEGITEQTSEKGTRKHAFIEEKRRKGKRKEQDPNLHKDREKKNYT